MELKELTEDFEMLIVAWLKSDDENATNLAHSLAKYAIKKQLPIHGVSIMLPDQKEIISKGMELAKQGKLKNDKANIKDYLFGFIDGFRYTKQKIETKGN